MLTLVWFKANYELQRDVCDEILSIVNCSNAVADPDVLKRVVGSKDGLFVAQIRGDWAYSFRQ